MSATDPLCIHLPGWLRDYINQAAELHDDTQRMQWVIEAARRNALVERSGGPFAAAVFERDSGRLVALGVNLVPGQGLSILHAEMVALSLAQRAIGHFDLGAEGQPAHELLTSCEPCAMCFGAVPWSGVTRLVCGARDADARAIGFDEGPKLDEWQAALEARGIEVVRDVCREAAAELFEAYRQLGGPIYNSRGG